MAAPDSFYTPYTTSPTVGRNLITEVDTAYLFGMDKATFLTTDLPAVVEEGFQMLKTGPVRVEGRLSTFGQTRIMGANAPQTGLILPASNITVEHLTGSTYTTVQDYVNTMTSPGLITGGEIINAGGGDITVGAGTAMLRVLDDNVSTLKFVNFSATTFTVPNDATLQYLGLDYNGGSPVVLMHTTFDWDNDTQIALGNALQFDGFMYIFNNPFKTGDPITNIIQRFDSLVPSNRDVVTGGLTLGETGTRNITMTAGRIWSRLNDFPIPAIDTSVADFFASFYFNGTTWVSSGYTQTQWDNLQYNNVASGLVAMTAGYYANLFFYVDIDHGYLNCIYGQDQFSTLAAAVAETGPSQIPTNWNLQTLPVAKLTFLKSASTAAEISQAYTSPFQSNPVSVHNDLSGLQGGTGGEYYHLTAAEYAGTGTGNFVRLNSPTLTGTPLAPTAAPGTNTTQIATTAFVTAAVAANVVTLTGDVTGSGTSSIVTTLATSQPGAHTWAAVQTISNATVSSSSITGALIVTGGAGIGGAVFVGGAIRTNSTTTSSSVTTGSLIADGGLGVAGTATIGGIVSLTSNTASTTTTTGSLVVTGGVGVSGRINCGSLVTNGGNATVINTSNPALSITDSTAVKTWSLYYQNSASKFWLASESTVADWISVTNGTGSLGVVSTTASSSTTTGALVVGGGTGIGGAVFAGGAIKTNSTTASTSSTTGSLIASGGLGVAGAAFVGGAIRTNSTTASSSVSTGALISDGGLGVAGAVFVGGITSITSATASTNTTTGALVVTGGIGVGGAVNIGGSAVATGALQIASSATGTSGGIRGLLCVLTYAPSAATTATYVANDTRVQSSVAANGGVLIGLNGEIRVALGATGTYATCYGTQTVVNNQSTATITDAVGLFVAANSNSGGGAITNNYGILIGNQSVGGTSNYAIYTNSGRVRLGDTTASTSTTTGSLITSGGLGVAGALFLDGATTKVLSYVNATANAAVAVTFGAVGPTGSTAGNQLGWIRVNVAGTDRYVPYW